MNRRGFFGTLLGLLGVGARKQKRCEMPPCPTAIYGHNGTMCLARWGPLGPLIDSRRNPNLRARRLPDTEIAKYWELAHSWIPGERAIVPTELRRILGLQSIAREAFW